MIFFGKARKARKAAQDADEEKAVQEVKAARAAYRNQFKITLETKGRSGDDSFELWLRVESLCEKDAVFNKGYVSLWFHYGNFVSGLSLVPVDALPTTLKSKEVINCCIHKGNALPTPKAGSTGWKHGDKVLVELESYADFHAMMKDVQLELELGFHIRTSEPEDPIFPSLTGGRKRVGKGYSQPRRDPTLGFSLGLNALLGGPMSKSGTEYFS